MAKKNDIQIIITAIDKASKELRTIDNAMDGMAKTAAIAGGALIAAGSAVGLAAWSLAKDAAPVEGIKRAFEGLTSTIEGGSKTMLQALEESSYGMVNQTDLMKSFNSASQLVSKDFAQQMPEAMKYLSKVSAATGQDMGFMIDSMVKGVGRLSPMILDNLGIQVDLTQATERAAQMYGIATDALSKEQIQAGMMNVVLEKLKTNTADMPEIAGTAAQSFATLGAQFENIKTEIGLKLLPLFNTIAQKLIEIWNDPKIQAGIDNVLLWLEKVVGNEESGLIGIVSYLMQGEIEKAFEIAFGDGAYQIVKGFFDDFKIAIGNMESVLEGFKKFFTDFGTEFIGMVENIRRNIVYLQSAANLVTSWATSSMGTGMNWKNLYGKSINMMGLGQYAEGGTFSVPGYGAGDRPYVMGLTPGETVSVTPRGQTAMGGLSLTVNINSAVNLADRNYAERELMPYIEAGIRQLMARGA